MSTKDPNLTEAKQIEQFIETMYPTQDPKKIATGQDPKHQGEPAMDRREAFIFVLVIVLVLSAVGGLMVRLFYPGFDSPPHKRVIAG
jgi:farnesyl-diphosphate farnesyltransferase